MSAIFLCVCVRARCGDPPISACKDGAVAPLPSEVRGRERERARVPEECAGKGVLLL